MSPVPLYARVARFTNVAAEAEIADQIALVTERVLASEPGYCGCFVLTGHGGPAVLTMTFWASAAAAEATGEAIALLRTRLAAEGGADVEVSAYDVHYSSWRSGDL